jgi:hypothetical protein
LTSKTSGEGEIRKTLVEAFNHASGGVKLPAFFAFCQGKFTEKVFTDHLATG